MSLIAPKPIIAHVFRTWRVPPGLTYALVEDLEKRLWVVESCPAGTQFWTLEQAAELPQGVRTRKALQEVLGEGRKRQTVRRPLAPVPVEKSAAPVAKIATGSRSAWTPLRRDKKLIEV